MNSTILDKRLLSTPSKLQTNWYVLTGAACSGKTTMIDNLAEKGYLVSPESARIYFDTQLAEGRTLQEIREDGYALQRGILDLQVEFEEKIETKTVTFLDRAIPDSLTFYRTFGLDPNEILQDCFKYQYAGVFLLDRLPFHREKTLGPEDDLASDFLNEWLRRDYETLGYKVIQVPFLPREERLSFILERIRTPLEKVE